MTMHRDADLALVPVRSNDAPALFQPWPDDVKTRCRELWASIGNRNASRTEWLYAKEVPAGVVVPAAATIRTWAREECWGAWADADLAASHGKTLQELRTGWLAALKLSQETLIDAMIGRLDHLPHAGAGRIKSAEVTLRLIAQSGLLAIVPEPPKAETNRRWEEMGQDELEAWVRGEYQRRREARLGGGVTPTRSKAKP